MKAGAPSRFDVLLHPTFERRLRELKPWSTATHRSLSPACREFVQTVLLCAHRLGRRDRGVAAAQSSAADESAGAAAAVSRDRGVTTAAAASAAVLVKELPSKRPRELRSSGACYSSDESSEFGGGGSGASADTSAMLVLVSNANGKTPEEPTSKSNSAANKQRASVDGDGRDTINDHRVAAVPSTSHSVPPPMPAEVWLMVLGLLSEYSMLHRA
jgi:hypothetical protein